MVRSLALLALAACRPIEGTYLLEDVRYVADPHPTVYGENFATGEPVVTSEPAWTVDQYVFEDSGVTGDFTSEALLSGMVGHVAVRGGQMTFVFGSRAFTGEQTDGAWLVETEYHTTATHGSTADGGYWYTAIRSTIVEIALEITPADGGFHAEGIGLDTARTAYREVDEWDNTNNGQRSQLSTWVDVLDGEGAPVVNLAASDDCDGDYCEVYLENHSGDLRISFDAVQVAP